MCVCVCAAIPTDAETMSPDGAQGQMQWALIGGLCGGLLAVGLILLLVVILIILMRTRLKKSTIHVPLEGAKCIHDSMTFLYLCTCSDMSY